MNIWTMKFKAHDSKVPAQPLWRTVWRFLKKLKVESPWSSVSHSVVSDSVRHHGLWSARLLCPWGSPGQNTGVGSLFQGIVPTQGLNPGLPHCRWILHQLSHKASPRILQWAALSLLQRIFPTQESNGFPALQEDSLPTELPGKPPKKWKSLSCVWLLVTPWTVQARKLEWVAFPFSRGSSQGSNPGLQPRSPALQADSLSAELLGKPQSLHVAQQSHSWAYIWRKP